MCLVLPAARPDQLEPLREPQQPTAGDQRNTVRHPIDQLEVRVRGPLLETEEADHTVDVDGQKRLRRRSYQR